MTPKEQISKASSAQSKLMTLLSLSDQVEIPRSRWIRKWLPPRGSKSSLRIGETTVWIMHNTNDHYSLSWGDKNAINQTSYEVLLNRIDKTKCWVTLVRKEVTLNKPSKNYGIISQHHFTDEELNEQYDSQDKLAQKACEYLGFNNHS